MSDQCLWVQVPGQFSDQVDPSCHHQLHQLGGGGGGLLLERLRKRVWSQNLSKVPPPVKTGSLTSSCSLMMDISEDFCKCLNHKVSPSGSQVSSILTFPAGDLRPPHTGSSCRGSGDCSRPLHAGSTHLHELKQQPGLDGHRQVVLGSVFAGNGSQKGVPDGARTFHGLLQPRTLPHRAAFDPATPEQSVTSCRGSIC